jgi:hypothetical protein
MDGAGGCRQRVPAAQSNVAVLNVPALLLFFLRRRLFFDTAFLRHVGPVRAFVRLDVFESSLRISHCV